MKMEKSVQTQEEATGRAKRYGEAVKRQVVEDLDRGRITLAQAQRQYGIAGAQTIKAWQGRYGKAGRGGGKRASAATALRRRIERLEREKAELEHALARSSVKAAALEALVEEAEAHYGEPLKKNFATGPLGGRRGGSGSGE